MMPSAVTSPSEFAALDATSSDAITQCFHCGEPLNGSTLQAQVRGAPRAVCCAGCLAVAELIDGAGLHDFYRYRDAPSSRPESQLLANDAWTAYDRSDIAAQFVTRDGDNDSACLLIEGLRCSACSWLIDRVLSRAPGVKQVDVNAATSRAYVQWDRNAGSLGMVLRTIAQLGYRPYPASDTAITQIRQDERRLGLKRLAVAALGMMQVMMFAVAVYAADLAGETMDPQLHSYFRLVSLLVATPVLMYAGKPFFVNAWNALRARTVGMDVPVSAALLLAFTASVWNTFRGSGEVYFDSVTMFVFFLTLGRFVEMAVRHRTTGITDALAQHVPASAHRMRDGAIEDVPTASLAEGDQVLVRPGEIVPVDGVIIDGDTHLDEALLTGESTPVHRTVGAAASAGTINTLAPIVIRVTATGSATLLSGIVALLRRAQARKPAVAQAADLAAAKFLRYVLLASGVVCGAWLAIDPSRAFEATLAVLVVACPCAFSIAMPAALAAATGELARQGVLVAHPDAIEALSKIERVVFDKTGTLTRGEVQLEHIESLADLSSAECLRIAAALESRSEHPIARAIARAAGQPGSATSIADVRAVAGFGIEGRIDGVLYRLGTPQFVGELRGETVTSGSSDEANAAVMLGNQHAALARFACSDTLRDEAVASVARLREQGIATEILSGDVAPSVRKIAAACGVDNFRARQSPAQKLARVQSLQQQGERVAMIGDGINDAPVLGAANVSIAMGRGAALALAAADIVLVSERISALPEAVATARRTMRIARQNLIWSAAYNFCALPLAALGLIAPWAAAAGMSISSIAVMMNALRVRNAARHDARRLAPVTVRRSTSASQFDQPARRPIGELAP
jgi:Cu2+-exporting ATPase